MNFKALFKEIGTQEIERKRKKSLCEVLALFGGGGGGGKKKKKGVIKSRFLFKKIKDGQI